MVINEPSGSPSENLLAAGTLDDIAGQATRKCESCGVAEVPVGPCFVRDQALSGFSNPNTRICLYAARRPLNADIYPPFDQSTRHALEAQLEFVPRSEDENHKTRFANTIEKIELKAEHVVAVSNAFEENQVVVLKAPTGFGKSTKLPYWLCWHEDSKFSYNSGKVIVTEPKRLAAEGVAGTVSMAHQYQPPAPGLDVGLQHGGVSSSGESNKLIFVTDGSLINRLIKRELDDVQLIIVDEAHERNERIELILLILRFLLPQYPHLKLLILSATIDPQNFTTYFQPKDESGSGDSRSEAPFISVRACEIEWKPEQAKFEVQEVWSREGFKPKFDAAGLKKIVSEACIIAREKNGHVLVFLPGEPEIDKFYQEINTVEGFKSRRLFGKTSQEERDEIQNCSASEQKLLILATNVAESSVTFTDLVCVVDSGLRKRSKNDDLETVEITQAEQKQRRGRVGRNREGWYFAAFSESDKGNFKEYPDSSLVDLSDYRREVMLLQAMSVGIAPAVLVNPQSYLMTPKELGKPTGRVLTRIRKKGGLAGQQTDEYLTPVGLLAAQAGVSVELAQLLLIGDHHNVLTEMSAVVANMSWRREQTNLAGVDMNDLLPDHVDNVPPATLQNDVDEPDEDPITDDESPGVDDDDDDVDVDNDDDAIFWARRDVEGELRDSYLLQSFDKLEEDKFSDTAALLFQKKKDGAKSDALLQLEKTNRIQRQFQERVPEDRLREMDPRLFPRVQLALDYWRTNGWRFEVSLVADANLLHKGSKIGSQGNDSTQREKNLQKLWELEGRLVRTHGSKADDVILRFARVLLKDKRACRVVSQDQFGKEYGIKFPYDGKFKDLLGSDGERRSDRFKISGQLKTFLTDRHSQISGGNPLEIIVDASNVCRKKHGKMDINEIISLMDELASVEQNSKLSYHDFRNSLIANLSRSLPCMDGEIDEATREDLVPELSVPVGSRWQRIERTPELKRNKESERHFIDGLSSGDGHSLLPKANDDASEKLTEVTDGVGGVLKTWDLVDKCFFADMLKKQYLTTPAKAAQSLRQGKEELECLPSPSKEDKRLTFLEVDDASYFRARRTLGDTPKIEIIPSYLESEVIAKMSEKNLTKVQFSIHRDQKSDHYVTGRTGEVKTVNIKLKIADDFAPIVELGAWQICPWFSAVPDRKEYGAKKPKEGEEKQLLHSKLPINLDKFGDHNVEIVSLGGRDRLLCKKYDKTVKRDIFIAETVPQDGESLETQRARFFKASKEFLKHHKKVWDILQAPQWVREDLDIAWKDRPVFKVQVGKCLNTKKKVQDEKRQLEFEVTAVGPEHACPNLRLRIYLADGIDPNSIITDGWAGKVLDVRVSSVSMGRCDVSLTRKQQETIGLVEPRDYGKQKQARQSSVKPSQGRVTPTPAHMWPATPARPASKQLTARPSRTKSLSSIQRKQFSRRLMWLALIGIAVMAVISVGELFSNRVGIFDDSAVAPATSVFSPATIDDWLVALNCVEDPSERDVGSVATAVVVCYSESNPDRHSISLFRYDDQPGDSEVNRRAERACSKRRPTGEVFAFYSPGQPAFFIYTIYEDAVNASNIPEYFERLSC